AAPKARPGAQRERTRTYGSRQNRYPNERARTLLTSRAQQTGGRKTMQTTNIHERLRVAVERGDVPGVVAMAATRSEVVYEGAFGRRATDGAPMANDTVFWIASMTKAITSMAAMQLVEQGKLALEEPVAGVLPELSAPQVLTGFSASGEPQ